MARRVPVTRGKSGLRRDGSPELELKVEEDFVSDMTMLGYLNIKADKLNRGWSDRIFFGYGRDTRVVEFKREKTKDGRRGEKLQKYMRDQFKVRGYPTHRVRGRTQARLLFRRITGKEMSR